MSATLHHRVGPVRPPEPIFLGPALGTFGHRRIEARPDPIPVRGMDPFVPPRPGTTQLGGLVVEQGLGSFIPDQAVGDQIPVGNCFVRRLGQQTMALLTHPERCIGELSIGDVLDGGHEMARLPIGGRDQGNVYQCPYDLPRRPDVPLLHGIGPALAGQQEPQGLEMGGRVIRVGPGLGGEPDQLIPGHTQDLTDRLVDPEPAAIGREKRHPHPGVLEAAVELLLTLPLALLGLPALGDFGAQLDLGCHRGRQVLEEGEIPF